MKRYLALLAAACLLLGGCASLLERSYSFIEPYTDRYWDTTAEDTLRAENYQDLVNSLLMLVQQRSEEGIIRYYGEERSYAEALRACQEVRHETASGAYLLRDLSFGYESAETYCTITCTLAYREDVEEPESLMILSDSQSLVDLLRLALREEHPRLTAQFVYESERQEDVILAVEGLWQELYLASIAPPEEELPPDETEEGAEAMGREGAEDVPPEGEVPPETETQPEDGTAPEAGSAPEDVPPEPPLAGEEPPPSQEQPEDPDAPADGEEVPAEGEELPIEVMVEIPPCPWEIRFYPDMEYAEIVEIILE